MPGRGGGPGGSKPGLWAGFKKGETAVDRQAASEGGGGSGERDGLLEKDYMAEARMKRERFQACVSQVSAMTGSDKKRIQDGWRGCFATRDV